jgi:TRAP transporter TAXI family solute receptor
MGKHVHPMLFRCDQASVAVLVACLTAAACSPAGGEPPATSPTTIRISSGSPTGNFLPFSTALAKGYARLMPDLRVDLVDTAGSVRNIDALQEGTVDIGLAQAGLAYMAYNGRLGEAGQPMRNIRGIAVLNSSAVQLLVGPGLSLRSMDDLRGRRVGIGHTDGSGAAVTSQLVLRGYFSSGEVQELDTTVAEATEMLLTNSIDAAFTISSLPNDEVRRQIEAGARFLEVQGPGVDRLLTTYPFFRPDIIPAGTYPGQAHPVHTLAIDVVLLARAGLDDALVRRLTDGLFQMLPQLTEELSFLKDMAPERAPATPVPLHPGAVLHYRERELSR